MHEFEFDFQKDIYEKSPIYTIADASKYIAMCIRVLDIVYSSK